MPSVPTFLTPAVRTRTAHDGTVYLDSQHVLPDGPVSLLEHLKRWARYGVPRGTQDPGRELKMERRHLVVREKSAQDGRARALYLTGPGERSLRELRTRVLEVDRAQMAGLDEREKRQLKKLLLKVRGA